MITNHVSTNEQTLHFQELSQDSSLAIDQFDDQLQINEHSPAEKPLYLNQKRNILSFSYEEEKPMPNKFALEWDGQGQKQYELGVSKGVLYKYNATDKKWYGVAWNGLISVSESPDGAEENELWADNIKYGGIRSAEKFSGSIEAYTYPEEFEGCDGLSRPVKGMTIGQQKREPFCLCYRTEIGNDMDPEAGYRLHLVYNATCSPSEKSYETINDSPDAITFSWDFDTTPVPVTGYKNTSHLSFDSTDFVTDAEKKLLSDLEQKLYGQAEQAAHDDQPAVEYKKPELPMPDDIIDMMTPD